MLAPLAAAAAIAGCPLFPSSWSTNQRVDALPDNDQLRTLRTLRGSDFEVVRAP